MNEKSSEVGFGTVLAVVLLLFAAPMIGLVLLGVTMYLLRAQGPTQPVYATAMAATGPVAYPTPVATAAAAPVQAVVAQRTAELIISADNRLASAASASGTSGSAATALSRASASPD